MIENSKTLAVLGSTGSIGRQTIDVARYRKVKINAIAFGSNYEIGREQLNTIKPEYCAVSNVETAKKLSDEAKRIGTELFCGENCIDEMLSKAQSDVCINGIGGFDGLMPTLSALKYCKRLGLANKESLVAAGDIVKSEAKKYGKEIIPVDSEHSAIFRCIGGNVNAVNKLIITCSGGAFYEKKLAELEDEDDYLIIKRGMLDIDEALREAIYLEFPYRLLCSEDCPGLCPHCGKKLRKGEVCGCHKRETDPRWDKLKKLLENEENGDEK